MPAAVKRVKSLSPPPRLCSGACYWQNLARLLRQENRVLRRNLIKARAEKRPAKQAPEQEQLRPIRESFAVPHDDVAADLVELFHARG